MERARSAPHAPSDDGEVASVPRGHPELKALVEELRSPGAAQVEVDALLAGLSLPLLPEQSPRERADLLLSLIDDAHLSSLVGSGGRTVRNAAVQALLALGYPYALEVPPDALAAELPPEPSRRRNLLANRWARVGFGLIITVSMMMLLPALYVALSWVESTDPLVLGMALFGGATLVPAFLTVIGHNSRKTVLKGFGITWLLFASAILATVPNLFVSTEDIVGSLIGRVIGGLFLLGTGLMAFPSQP